MEAGQALFPRAVVTEYLSTMTSKELLSPPTPLDVMEVFFPDIKGLECHSDKHLISFPGLQKAARHQR